MTAILAGLAAWIVVLLFFLGLCRAAALEDQRMGLKGGPDWLADAEIEAMQPEPTGGTFEEHA